MYDVGMFITSSNRNVYYIIILFIAQDFKKPEVTVSDPKADGIE